MASMGSVTIERGMAPTSTRGPRVPDLIRSDPRRGFLAAVAAISVLALMCGWLTPRGPLTPSQVIVTTVAVVATGLVAGLAAGSRWSMAWGPVVFIVVFELARTGTQGATVDAIHLGSAYGILAFVVGRVAHGLMVLPALMLASWCGVWLASRRGHPRASAPGTVGVIGAGATGLVVVAMTAALVQDGSTAPILGPDGQPLPGSIAELVEVEIGDVTQTIMLRGRDATRPVLLHLAGGPGGTDLGAMRADTGLESDLVVATWEQRGTGRSYASSIDPVERLTVEQAVADTVEVTEYLRERFGVERIYVSANSWGTIPGVLAVQQAPELFHAYVGTGQMVDVRATDRMFYEDALAWAGTTGRDALAERIRAAGPPPYVDLLDYEHTVSHEHQWNAYPGVDDLWEMPFNTFVPENSLLDRINALRGLLDVNSFLYPQLQGLDLRRDVTRLEVPVHVVLGRYEARGRAVLANEWFDALDAPSKQLVVFDRSGHRPSFEQPGDFVRLMREVVAATSGGAGS